VTKGRQQVTLSLFHASHFQLTALLAVLSYFTPVTSIPNYVKSLKDIKNIQSDLANVTVGYWPTNRIRPTLIGKIFSCFPLHSMVYLNHPVLFVRFFSSVLLLETSRSYSLRVAMPYWQVVTGKLYHIN